MPSLVSPRGLVAVLMLASMAAHGSDSDLRDQKIVAGEACTVAALGEEPDNASVATACAVYAMLASNAYRDGRMRFVLPEGWRKRESYPAELPRDERGLSYDIYEYASSPQPATTGEQLDRTVIVVTGTDQWRDLLYGSLTAAQHRRFRQNLERYQEGHPDADITQVVGHSLGGGLAINASFNFAGVDAVTFNGSPRIGGKGRRLGNQRMAIYESGEIVRKLGNALFPWRWQWLRGDKTWAQIHYRRFHYTDGNAITNHAIHRIAWGMLGEAAGQSQEMREILLRNCHEYAMQRASTLDAPAQCAAASTGVRMNMRQTVHQN